MSIKDIEIAAAIKAVISIGSPRFLIVADQHGNVVHIPNEQAIRNLRAACDAALGEAPE